MDVVTNRTWRSLPGGSTIKDVADIPGTSLLGGIWTAPDGGRYIAAVPRVICEAKPERTREFNPGGMRWKQRC